VPVTLRRWPTHVNYCVPSEPPKPVYFISRNGGWRLFVASPGSSTFCLDGCHCRLFPPSFGVENIFYCICFPTWRGPSPLARSPTTLALWVELLSLCYARNRVLRKEKRSCLFDGWLGFWVGMREGGQPWYVTWHFRFGRRGHIPQESLFIGVMMTSRDWQATETGDSRCVLKASCVEEHKSW
jgi:hypothetical protein